MPLVAETKHSNKKTRNPAENLKENDEETNYFVGYFYTFEESTISQKVATSSQNLGGYMQESCIYLSVIANCKTDHLMKKHRTLILTLSILATLGILIFRGFRYDWSPHYINNNAMTINEKLFSPDSSIAVVYYTLDVGARGDRLYKSLLRAGDYDDELTTYNLPPEIVVINWVDNQTLNVRYDPNEIYRLGGTHTDLDLTKDTIIVNGIKLIVTERKPNEKYVP